LNCRQTNHRIRVLATLALAWQWSVAAPAFSGESAKPVVEKWRPKDGPYASPSADLSQRCLDFGDVVVNIAERSINGSEQLCKIIKITDSNPDVIKLDVTCTDIENKKPYKQVVLLKKIDDKTILVRRTYEGRFKYPGEKVSYCPEEAQRMYIESRKKVD
jgi:hypothetical protein